MPREIGDDLRVRGGVAFVDLGALTEPRFGVAVVVGLGVSARALIHAIAHAVARDLDARHDVDRPAERPERNRNLTR
mgnify:CR=1 FL=1